MQDGRYTILLTNTPSQHDNTEPQRRARPLHHDVAGDFGRHVPREEDRERDLQDT